VPTYEYKCTQCDNQYETREGFDAPSRQACPRCGGVAKRLLFPPPIVFKGSGFYITDSRKGSQVTVDSSTPSATSAASTPAKPETAAGNGDAAAAPAPPAAPSASTNHDA
jgi:putative FmdB family regulatory protein